MGDVVFLRKKNLGKNPCPINIIVIQGPNDYFSKAKVRSNVNKEFVDYTKPIIEMILLVKNHTTSA